MTYGAKVLTIGVGVKAVLMGLVVTLLAATAFWQSLVLIVVSAAVTGVFAILVVLIQTHAERTMHIRLDRLERNAQTAVSRQLEEQTKTIVETITTTPETP